MLTRLAAPASKNFRELNGRAGFAILSHSGNFKEFPLDFRGVAAADVSGDLAGVIEATNRRKIARGVWQGLDTDEQEDGGNTLESKKKSPADVRVAIVDEGQSE